MMVFAVGGSFAYYHHFHWGSPCTHASHANIGIQHHLWAYLCHYEYYKIILIYHSSTLPQIEANLFLFCNGKLLPLRHRMLIGSTIDRKSVTTLMISVLWPRARSLWTEQKKSFSTHVSEKSSVKIFHFFFGIFRRSAFTHLVFFLPLLLPNERL